LRRAGRSDADVAYVTDVSYGASGVADLKRPVANLKNLTWRRMLIRRSDSFKGYTAQGSTEAELRSWHSETDSLLENYGSTNWRALFHTYEEILNCPPARFAIEGFLQEDGITLIGGLAESAF